LEILSVNFETQKKEKEKEKDQKNQVLDSY
jgi:hypothetical protein